MWFNVATIIIIIKVHIMMIYLYPWSVHPENKTILFIELMSRSLTVGKSLSPVDFPSAPGWLELPAPWVGLPELLSRYWQQSNLWTRACITGLLLMAFATFFFSHRPQSFMRVEGIHMTGCCPVPQRDCLKCCHHHLSAFGTILHTYAFVGQSPVRCPTIFPPSMARTPRVGFWRAIV
jgi:hypothetical protein